MSQPMWTPSRERIESSNIESFRREVERRWGVDVPDYDALWRWSVDELEQFWATVWDFCAVIGDGPGEPILVDGDKMPGAKFFPQARLNFAENLLRRQSDQPALIFWGEDKERRTLSWAELYGETSRMAQALADFGLRERDRVAAYIPNMPEAPIAMLATTSMGAIYSSCSPDFGAQGVIDRFGQIEPRVLISADGYWYNGKAHSSLDKLPEIVADMPSVEKVIVVPYLEAEPDISAVPNAVLWSDFVGAYEPARIDFKRLPLDHPVYILYSSGTTGVPKCIVHGAGGALLQHLKEHQLICDIRAGDRLFWFTTCGWMMWNWLVSGLASEATLLLYDGSPFHPDGNVLFDFADTNKMAFMGVSAKFFDACNKADLAPIETHDLSTVRTIGSTGSPLVPEGFDYVYSKVKEDVHLASMSGGTDLLACFCGGNPLGPVYRGEIQAPSLGMATQVFDDDGNPVVGQAGELVCTRPFPSMPLGFWNDPGDEKYHAAYYEQFPNVWTHGDWVEQTENGGFVIYGRSDATLNPGGVRIGTAEIYRQVEKLDEVVESLVIGQNWKGDSRVVLFVLLRDGLALDDALTDRIKKQIRDNTTPRHVPAKVIQVNDIPRTKNNKIVELAVRHVVHGRPVKNKEALANPEALDEYENIPALQDD